MEERTALKIFMENIGCPTQFDTLNLNNITTRRSLSALNLDDLTTMFPLDVSRRIYNEVRATINSEQINPVNNTEERIALKIFMENIGYATQFETLALNKITTRAELSKLEPELIEMMFPEKGWRLYRAIHSRDGGNSKPPTTPTTPTSVPIPTPILGSSLSSNPNNIQSNQQNQLSFENLPKGDRILQSEIEYKLLETQHELKVFII
eukprot:TRINITY_DN559_c0_g1_i4.p1 TRINITY_DN559_c0_g1~~TRINITY_DN559_c0_g1_i4.p1  ORF type:complete len:208 (+),score=48.90 TRINITY_DN559_c0_g1_i4:208-831(+)